MTQSSWHYQRRRDASQLEQASWIGTAVPPLATHFHAGTQITIVTAGSRRFRTPAGPVVANAGQTAILPAGLPHGPLGRDTLGTVSFNLYLPETIDCRRQVCAAIIATPPWLVIDAPLNLTMLTDLTETARARRPSSRHAYEADELVAEVIASPRPIRDVAALFGVTREGFIRRFSRVTGMTPHAFRIIHRLNAARAMLAAGLAPAAAAAEAGFADQSHLGRAFRMAFGTAPAAYRRTIRN